MTIDEFTSKVKAASSRLGAFCTVASDPSGDILVRIRYESKGGPVAIDATCPGNGWGMETLLKDLARGLGASLATAHGTARPVTPKGLGGREYVKDPSIPMGEMRLCYHVHPDMDMSALGVENGRGRK